MLGIGARRFIHRARSATKVWASASEAVADIKDNAKM